MKNSANEDPTLIGFIKDDMLVLLDSAKTWMYRIARPSEMGPLGDAKEAFNKAVQIKISLRCTPNVCGVIGDLGEVKFGGY